MRRHVCMLLNISPVNVPASTPNSVFVAIGRTWKWRGNYQSQAKHSQIQFCTILPMYGEDISMHDLSPSWDLGHRLVAEVCQPRAPLNMHYWCIINVSWDYPKMYWVMTLGTLRERTRLPMAGTACVLHSIPQSFTRTLPYKIVSLVNSRTKNKIEGSSLSSSNIPIWLKMQHSFSIK